MPGAPEELQADQETPLITMWFETKSGTRYELPDMNREQVNSAHRQLDGDFDKVMTLNISSVLLLIPKAILARAGTGSRCFWENDAD